MGLDYSYTQPSELEDYGENSADTGFSETEFDIMLDQAEIDATRVVYPPQPEVEFGFPKECYCGGQPVVETAYTRTDPGRRFYTCENRADGDCHVWKWWDVAVMEEMKAMCTQCGLLSQKVDSLSFVTDYESHLNRVKELHDETEQKLARLEKICGELGKKKTRLGKRDEFVVGVMVFLLLIIAIVLMVK
ncbi:hypothetical protein Bca101_066253 [Brassica carinata]